MYLLDTNILLELLLDQEKADQAVQDLLVTGGMGLARLEIEDMQDIVQAAQKFRLDFDDAYQYVAAEKYELIIVSFDGDFDRTERGRTTPADVLQASF